MDTIWATPLPDAKGPKYTLVAETIRRAVSDGQLEHGAKLPPVRDLAFRLQITPGTVARAYSMLTDEGLLVGEVGRGTFVAEPRAVALDEDNECLLEIDVIAHGSEHRNAGDVNLFSPHLPAVGQTTLIRKLLADIAKDPPSGLMHYPSRQSSRPARQAVVSWMEGAPIGPFGAEDVVLTNGGQNAISLILQAVLKGRRPAVLVEELSYPGFRRAAELLRADVVPVAMDADGIDPAALEAAIRSCDAQVLCTSPEVHNPTLLRTPLARRRQIAEICRRHDVQIIEDEVYRTTRAEVPTYRMLAPERAWYVSSISKLITPSLRVGFAVAPEGSVAAVRRASEHGFFGVATPIADLTAMLLGHPRIGDLRDQVCERIGAYVQCAVNVLGMYDLHWREDVPFLWLVLPLGWRAGAFCRAAETQGVQIRSAEDFATRNTNTPHAVRMAINAGVPLPTFEAALTRLRRLLDEPPEQLEV
ncbi:PLP-dependent aminotransferase family protein [Chachezhania antarctica]|uniref:aminotransferase-like domain-containing protein n=1 Tax=Chachezhania antarctica TaxID=2340860 RepID=UPI000EAF449D|nr:PLP-dependent aminotransferase family protein [Chachezhania antarctica]|tara:strand:+ start:350 stop:1771 length:1422 start_codon:yes stop_codon:yes gene_type:complete